MQHKDQTIFLASYAGPKLDYQLMDSMGVTLKQDTISDNVQVDLERLEAYVNNAMESKKICPVKVPIRFNDFCEFVLPYRIGTENLMDWQSYFRNHYLPLLKANFGDSLTVKRFITYINNETEGWFTPSPTNAIAPAATLDMKMIINIKYAWSCVDRAVLKIFIARSLGIPTAYEFIPIFAKFNGWHVEPALLHENGKYYPCTSDEDHFKYQIAKMYRTTFSKQVNQFQKIIEMGEQASDVPVYFDDNHRVDITEERTPVSDIVLKAPDTTCNVYYLCIYNDGEWKPVAWTSRKEKEHLLIFKNMGRKILYHLLTIHDGVYTLHQAPFTLDTLGIVHYLNHPSMVKETIAIRQYDRNINIVKGELYILSQWNEQKQLWETIGSYTGGEKWLDIDSGLFSGKLYRLLPSEESISPVRPFTLNDKGNQIWW
ncbi:hypothetical protein [Chitinophaga sp. 30R24]|uniref:hypothetical protein n=1 Tax=Chitinophaga sp. 30R24 TaxID=3248838 RepID=UPI003B982858